MAILRPMLMPTVGIPQTVVASRRPRNMSQKEFYNQTRQQTQQLPDQQQAQPQQIQQQSGGDVFEQAPVTGDYIQQQLARMSQREAPPVLNPSSRVKPAEAELVQPSNFQSYYEQLQAMRNQSDQLLGAVSARAAYQRAQEMSSLSGGSVGAMSGLPIGYKNTGGLKSLSKGGNKKKSLTKGGNAYGSAVPANPKANFKFAQEIGPQYGWSGPELQAWYTLGMKESGWRNTAQNPTSTAYGIGQFLNSTWKGVGMTKTSDPRLQVIAMAKYIKNRYGSPSRALAFHLRNNWY